MEKDRQQYHFDTYPYAFIFSLLVIYPKYSSESLIQSLHRHKSIITTNIKIQQLLLRISDYRRFSYYKFIHYVITYYHYLKSI